eukprot:CAMPEP_0184676652 /NCGR_PEP_ID=MMETSP0308-20130426/88464_1 /TAXON_ID=38269 /ORGANISM="Gloeochaete witrockiana, Strain SAG 46.84" /LENGTH=190 /DNA_ID=CAMNT_0027124497 /DNA_START=1254 /DNA_END=1826 /DNA_ORIENTATION=-
MHHWEITLYQIEASLTSLSLTSPLERFKYVNRAPFSSSLQRLEFVWKDSPQTGVLNLPQLQTMVISVSGNFTPECPTLEVNSPLLQDLNITGGSLSLLDLKRYTHLRNIHLSPALQSHAEWALDMIRTNPDLKANSANIYNLRLALPVKEQERFHSVCDAAMLAGQPVTLSGTLEEKQGSARDRKRKRDL